MDRASKLRPSPSMAVALLALFISLSGGAIAVTKDKERSKPQAVPKNSVGPRQLKPGALTAPDIAPNAVGAPALAADAVTGAKIRDGSVVREDLPNQIIDSHKVARLPGASAEETNNVTVGGSAVQLSYDVELFDFTGDMYFSADPAKMVAPRDGVFQVTASLVWQAEVGIRTLTLVEEQANPVCTCEFDADTRPASASGSTSQSITSMVELDQGDKVWASADSTGDDGSTDIVTTRRPRLTMTWAGPSR